MKKEPSEAGKTRQLLKEQLDEIKAYDKLVSSMTHDVKRLSPIEKKSLQRVEREFFMRESLGYFPGAAMGISLLRRDGKVGPKAHR